MLPTIEGASKPVMYVWIRMERDNNRHVFVALCYGRERCAGMVYSSTEVLAAVDRGYDDVSREVEGHNRAQVLKEVVQRVDSGIASHTYPLLRDALINEVITCVHGGGEVQVGDLIHQATIHLLWVWVEFVTGA